MADLLGYEPPARPERPVAAEHRAWPTDAECRAKERALRPFVAWLYSADEAALRTTSGKALAVKYPPLEGWDLQQMLDVRLKNIGKRK